MKNKNKSNTSEGFVNWESELDRVVHPFAACPQVPIGTHYCKDKSQKILSIESDPHKDRAFLDQNNLRLWTHPSLPVEQGRKASDEACPSSSKLNQNSWKHSNVEHPIQAKLNRNICNPKDPVHNGASNTFLSVGRAFKVLGIDFDNIKYGWFSTGADNRQEIMHKVLAQSPEQWCSPPSMVQRLRALKVRTQSKQ